MSKIGFIYKLASKDVAVKEIYVGSTTNLKMRKHGHKWRCNHEDDKDYNIKVYQFIRANGGFSSWDIIQLERVEFETKYELRARERHFVELLNPSLNKQLPNRTNAESYRRYYDNHKAEILKKHSTKFNCDCGGIYSYSHKSLHVNTKKHINYISSLPAT